MPNVPQVSPIAQHRAVTSFTPMAATGEGVGLYLKAAVDILGAGDGKTYHSVARGVFMVTKTIAKHTAMHSYNKVRGVLPLHGCARQLTLLTFAL